jgi:hypothetical protein
MSLHNLLDAINLDVPYSRVSYSNTRKECSGENILHIFSDSLNYAGKI